MFGEGQVGKCESGKGHWDASLVALITCVKSSQSSDKLPGAYVTPSTLAWHPHRCHICVHMRALKLEVPTRPDWRTKNDRSSVGSDTDKTSLGKEGKSQSGVQDSPPKEKVWFTVLRVRGRKAQGRRSFKAPPVSSTKRLHDTPQRFPSRGTRATPIT